MTKLIAVAFALALAACNVSAFGTAGYDVTLINHTEQAVFYRLFPEGEQPIDTTTADGRKIPPGSKVDDHWRSPSSRPFSRNSLLRVTEAGGRAIFCRSLNYDDIKQAGYVVDIRFDPPSCADSTN